jgi:hypothetical protein
MGSARTESGVQADSSVVLLVGSVGMTLTCLYGRALMEPSPWASSLVAHGLCLVVGQGDILRCDIEFTVAMEMLDPRTTAAVPTTRITVHLHHAGLSDPRGRVAVLPACDSRRRG